MLHGCVPVNATLNEAFCPVQILVVPLIVAVGSGLTVTVADPLPVFSQLFTSLTLVTV